MNTQQRSVLRGLLLGVAGGWCAVAIAFVVTGVGGPWLWLVVALVAGTLIAEQIVAGPTRRFFHPVVGLEWDMWVIGTGIDFSETPVVFALALGPLQFGIGFGIMPD